jgi:hypothetical protein
LISERGRNAAPAALDCKKDMALAQLNPKQYEPIIVTGCISFLTQYSTMKYWDLS